MSTIHRHPKNSTRRGPSASYAKRRSYSKIKASPSDSSSKNLNNEDRDSISGKKLFVAPLPVHVQEKDLKQAFSKFGRLSSIELAKDKLSSYCTGYAYICFERLEDAQQAEQASVLFEGYKLFQTSKVGSKDILRYISSLKDRKLFINKIPHDCSKLLLYNNLSRYGPIEQLYIFRDGDPNKMDYGFVVYYSKDCARKILGQNIYAFSQKIILSWHKVGREAKQYERKMGSLLKNPMKRGDPPAVNKNQISLPKKQNRRKNPVSFQNQKEGYLEDFQGPKVIGRPLVNRERIASRNPINDKITQNQKQQHRQEQTPVLIKPQIGTNMNRIHHIYNQNYQDFDTQPHSGQQLQEDLRQKPLPNMPRARLKDPFPYKNQKKEAQKLRFNSPIIFPIPPTEVNNNNKNMRNSKQSKPVLKTSSQQFKIPGGEPNIDTEIDQPVDNPEAILSRARGIKTLIPYLNFSADKKLGSSEMVREARAKKLNHNYRNLQNNWESRPSRLETRAMRKSVLEYAEFGPTTARPENNHKYINNMFMIKTLSKILSKELLKGTEFPKMAPMSGESSHQNEKVNVGRIGDYITQLGQALNFIKAQEAQSAQMKNSYYQQVDFNGHQNTSGRELYHPQLQVRPSFGGANGANQTSFGYGNQSAHAWNNKFLI